MSFGVRLGRKLGRRLGGDFSPLSIPDLALWLDAADTSTITTGATFTWADKSGNGNDATQTTGANQPETGIDMRNGRNVITFDKSSNQFLSLPQQDIFDIANGDSTLFVVSQLDASGNFEVMFSMGTGTTNNLLLFHLNDADSVAYRSGGTPNVTYAGVTKTDVNVYTGLKSGSTQSLFVNGGAPVSNTNAANISTVDNCSIGVGASGLYFGGKIAEIALYKRNLSSDELNAFGMYSSNKWNNSWSNS